MEGEENGKNYLGTESVNPDFSTIKSVNNNNISSPTHSSVSADLKSAESAAANPISSLSADAKSAEKNTPFKSSVVGRPDDKNKKKKKGFLRRSGPALTIGGISIFAFFGFSALFSPFLQLNHTITMASEKWGFSDYTLTRRTQQIFGLKTVGSKTPLTTGGVLGTNIGNRYRTVSARTLGRLESNGFKVEVGDTTLTGKYKIKNISYGDGNTFSTPKEFTSALQRNGPMRSDLNRVYKPRVAQMFDRIGEKFKNDFSIKKFFGGAPKTDADDDMTSALQKHTKSTRQASQSAGNSSTTDTYTEGEDGDLKPSNNPEANDLDGTLKSAANSTGAKTARGMLTALKALSVTQTICAAYQFGTSFTQLVKTTGLDQIMTSVATAFSVGDQVKAGSGDSEAVSAINTALNTPTSYADTVDEDGDVIESEPKAGSSAQAYQYAVQSTTISSSDQIDGSVSKYLMGGMPSAMQSIYGLITSKVGTVISSVCNALTNPIVVFGTIVATIALSVIATALSGGAAIPALASIGGSIISIKTLGSIGISIAINFAMELVVPTIAAIMAGDASCMFAKGQDMMNCLMVGFGGMAGKMAGAGGNTALTKGDAKVMYIDYKQYLDEIAEEERKERSPFDTTSPHTFLGSIASSFLPYINKSTNHNPVTTPLSSISSVASSSIASLIPKSSAFSFDLATFQDSMNVCNDYTYENIATDPFCNPIYGAPNIDTDAESILVSLAESGQITVSDNGSVSINKTYPDSEEETGISIYERKCVNRRAPLMMEVSGDDTGNGQECISNYTFSDPKGKTFSSGLYALFFIDNRIQDAVDGDSLLSLSDEFLDAAYSNNVAYYISDDPSSDMYIAGYFDNDDYEPTDAVIAYTNYVEEQESDALALFEDVINQAYLAQTGSTLYPTPTTPVKPTKIIFDKPITPEYIAYIPSTLPIYQKSKSTNTTA